LDLREEDFIDLRGFLDLRDDLRGFLDFLDLGEADLLFEPVKTFFVVYTLLPFLT
jgi:hypothetical protein